MTIFLCYATFTPRPLPLLIWKFIFSFLRPRTQVNARIVLDGLSENGQEDGFVPGATALWLAASKGDAECVEQLLAYEGANVQQPDTAGRTPLMIAQGKGHELCVALLSS